MLKDQFGRIHDYLRISLTDRCNYKCLYCLPQPEHLDDSIKGDCNSHGSDQMSTTEIISLAKIFICEGVKKIRITGGEPLVRKDASMIIRELGMTGTKLVLTTNGSRIHHFMDVFKEAGINSINVSLDTLNRDLFHKLTQRDDFIQVKNNIQLLLDHNFHVKINMVVMNGYNENELADFVEWTKEEPVHVRFIEFMPFPGNKWQPDRVIHAGEMLEIIARTHSEIIKLEDGVHDTTKKFQIKNYNGTFSIITTMSEPFCGGCNRLRLTSDGKMRNCLFSKTETDLLSALRSGEDVSLLIRSCLAGKHFQLGGNSGESWGLEETSSHRRSMMGIGG